MPDVSAARRRPPRQGTGVFFPARGSLPVRCGVKRPQAILPHTVLRGLAPRRRIAFSCNDRGYFSPRTTAVCCTEEGKPAYATPSPCPKMPCDLFVPGGNGLPTQDRKAEAWILGILILLHLASRWPLFRTGRRTAGDSGPRGSRWFPNRSQTTREGTTRSGRHEHAGPADAEDHFESAHCLAGRG